VSTSGPGAGGNTTLYGRNAVLEALCGRRRVRRVWAADERLAQAVRSRQPGVSVEGAADAELERMCGSPAHQGLVCEADPYPYAAASSLLERDDALVVALDQVQDPQNLGAVCRTAECAGAAGVVVPERRAAAVTPAVCRASAGAVEHLPVARVRNLADTLAMAKEAGAWVYGADQAARRPYTDVDWTGRAVIVLGSEGRGLRPRVREACDDIVGVPLRGRVASLNVSAAAAVLLYEAARFRAPPGAALDKST
jgi:23S rRNA (guanosine2251-2'-O)-methyltransferase